MSNTANIIPSDNDIAYVEKLLLKDNEHFDKEERLPIITDFSTSFDVNACPGSGKTTVLIAKLLILLSKMPLANHQGICVFTHTNVAINEIKQRLGDKSEILFKYPNYIGTIQHFVDEYLTKPFYRQRIGRDIISINDDRYMHELLTIYNQRELLDIKHTIAWCIEKQLGSYTEGDDKNNFIKFINAKKIDLTKKTVSILDSSGNDLRGKKYFSELENVMIKELLNKGILTYRHALSIAEDYLNIYPQLVSFFSNRFKYVFIDEMQDTKEGLNRIIDKVFDKQLCVIQRFGDLNQMISRGYGDEECGWHTSGSIRTINSSKRYGYKIIQYISPLRLTKSGDLSGNRAINTLDPYIIVFDDSSINNIEQTFEQIIVEENIHKIKDAKIKIVGWIAQKGSSDDLTLSRYFKDYEKPPKNDEYSKKVVNQLKKETTISSLWNKIEEIIIAILSSQGEVFTHREFKEYLNNNWKSRYEEIKGLAVHWFKNIRTAPEKILPEIQTMITSFIKEIWDIDISSSLIQSYINVDNITIAAKTAVSASNGHKYDIDTVHGVKGETHTATLYLETKYTSSRGVLRDISKVLEYIVGNKTIIEAEDSMEAAIAYVAMTRATHLTCLGVHINTVSGYLPQLCAMGMKIRACAPNLETIIQDILDVKEA